MTQALKNTHTWQEIYAQPTIWRDFAVAQQAALAEIREWVQTRKAERIFFSGAGTSAYIGQIVCATLSGDYHAIPTTDIVARTQDFINTDKSHLVVQFGRSGNSSETVGTLAILDQHCPAFDRLNITCNKDSALALHPPKLGEQRVVVLPEATHDKAFAMTSSFSTMYLTALAIFGKDEPAVWAARVKQLAGEAEKVLSLAEGFSLARPERCVILGTGPFEGISREIGLKIMELTAGKTATLWDSVLGFRHGPKSFIQADTCVLLLRHPHSHSAQYEKDLAVEIRQQFPEITLLELGAGGDMAFHPQGVPEYDALLPLMVGQVLAAKWSAAMQLNVDDPFIQHGHLSRVVSGVKLYDYQP